MQQTAITHIDRELETHLTSVREISTDRNVRNRLRPTPVIRQCKQFLEQVSLGRAEIAAVTTFMEAAFSGSLLHATDDERALIEEIAERRKSELRAKMVEANRSKEAVLTDVENATEVLRQADTIRRDKNLTVNPLKAEHQRLCDLFVVADGEQLEYADYLTEQHIVQSLYPELYKTDRPLAYRRFDNTLANFRKLDISKHDAPYNVYLQGGKLRHTDKSEARRTRATKVYRTVRASVAMAPTRYLYTHLTVNDARHVIDWEPGAIQP